MKIVIDWNNVWNSFIALIVGLATCVIVAGIVIFAVFPIYLSDTYGSKWMWLYTITIPVAIIVVSFAGNIKIKKKSK